MNDSVGQRHLTLLGRIHRNYYWGAFLSRLLFPVFPSVLSNSTKKIYRVMQQSKAVWKVLQ